MKYPNTFSGLAQAMRDGAKLGKQKYGVSLSLTDSCALGAVELALNPKADTLKTLWKHFAILFRIDQICGIGLYPEIIRRNDQLRQTREQIADWLESLDPKPETAPETETEEELVEV